MADEFLPPVVTKLKGDVRDLVAAIAEAKAAMAEYDKQVQEESVRAARTTGKTSGNALVNELRTALRAGELGEQDTAFLRGRIDTAFRKAGKDGAAGLYQEFAKVLGGGGLDTTVGRQVVNAFDEFGKTGALAFDDGFSKIFQGGFLSSLGNVMKIGAPAMIPMAILLASELLSALGGAVEAVGGLGGIFTASLIQLKTNPEVQAAAKDFVSWLGSEFKDETAVFAGPLEDAFGILKTDLRGPVADLGKDFAYLAPYVRDFAMYIGAAAEKFMPGFDRFIQSSGPELTELGHGLVYVTDGLNTMFDEISKGGKGEVEALDTLFRALGVTLAATGFLIRASASTWDQYVHVVQGAVDWTDKWLGSWTLFGPILRGLGIKDYVDGIAHSFDGGGPSIDGMGRRLNTLTADAQRQKDAVDALTKAWDDWFGLSMTTEQATLTLHQDVTALTDSIAQNGRTMDESTKAGQANYGALLQLLQANKDVYNANVKQYGDNPKFVQQYQDTYNWIIAQGKAAHLNADQIAALTSEFGQLNNMLNSLNGKVVHYSIVGSGPGQVAPSHFWQGLASGGFVAPGGVIHAADGMLPARNPGTLVLAGEPQTRGEWMIPRAGISQQRATTLLAGAAADHGMTIAPSHSTGSDRPIVVQLVLPDGRLLWEQHILPGALQTKRVAGSFGL